MTELPLGRWKEVAIDFAGPVSLWRVFGASHTVIDEFSRFPGVEILTSTSMRAEIPKLGSISARQGIPDVVKSVNGSSVNSVEFKKFPEHLGFRNRRVTTNWPKANGEVEKSMRTHHWLEEDLSHF